MSEQILPAIRYITGHPYVKVKDLADAWHTSTSSILATGKPNQVPEKYRKTIEGRTWCDVEGLRYRLDTMKTGSSLASQLKDLVDRFPEPSFTLTGPLMETVCETNGCTTTIYRSTFQNIDDPSSEELQAALENRKIIYRYKNKRIQVLAQTLSNYLDTRTSSLLAVNKKQGVPGKFIHREWKRTWVDLEGLKTRVERTEHGSALLKGLNWVVQYLDEGGKPFDQLVKTMKQWKSESAKAKQKKQQESASASASKPEQKPVKPCDLAVEANKRAVHNTERINKLATEVHDHEFEAVDRAGKRLTRLEGLVANMYRGIGPEGLDPEFLMKNQLNSIRGRLSTVEKQATRSTVDQTLLSGLHTRLGRVATQADSLDAKTEGLTSRVSVLEDTSKWLSWTLAGVIGLRFLGVTLRWLKRK